MCLAGFIIDLSLTMDILFYFARGGQPLTIRLINKALKEYQSRKKSIHEAVQSWINHSESIFDHFKRQQALEEMERIIFEYCIKPTQNSKVSDSQVDEDWISREELENVSARSS
jgi:hypothetical protein